MKSNDLYNLIQSLTQGEKRMVSEYSGIRESDNKYMELYRLLLRQKKYDEDAARKKLKIGDNRFSQIKRYLHQHILNTLQFSASDKPFIMEINKLYDQALILYHKSLYDQALTILNKAHRIASKGEQFSNLIQILQLKKNCYSWILDFSSMFEADKELTQVSNLLVNYEEYSSLKATIEMFGQISNDARVVRRTKRFYKEATDTLKKGESAALSKSAKLKYYESLRNLNVHDWNSEEILRTCTNRIKLFENSQEFKKAFFGSYITSLTEALPEQRKLGLAEEFMSTASLLRNSYRLLNSKISRTGAGAKALLVNEEFPFYFQRGNEIKLQETIDDAIELYNSSKTLFSERLSLVIKYDISLSYFYLGKVKESSQWARYIINEKSIKINQDILALARILQLLQNIEKANLFVLDSFIISTFRHLTGKGILFKGEKILIDFAKGIVKDFGSKKELLEKLIIQLNQLKKEKREAKFLDYLDVLTWAKSKLTGQSMMAIKKKEFQEGN